MNEGAGGPDVKLSASAAASASVALVPKRSQTVLGVLTGLAAVVFFLSVYLFTQNQETAGYAFLAVATLLTAAIIWAWSRSHTNQDLDGGQVRLETNEGTLAVDARVLDRLQQMQEFWKVLERVFTRQPIPAAVGMTDEKMQLVPNSASQAAGVVQEANAISVSACQALSDFVPDADIRKVRHRPSDEQERVTPNITADLTSPELRDGDLVSSTTEIPNTSEPSR